MKFCDKLQKLRKEKNMSQEMLADKCEVSRQAVSKWEMGKSYPDMDKINLLCRILECNIDDLLDDNFFNKMNKNKDINKKDISTYFKEFLDFLTKTVNMFFSMRFIEKLKFILEMLFTVILLLIVFLGIYDLIINKLMLVIFGGFLGNLGSYINNIIKFIYIVICLIIGIIITVHLLKVRYLDYFITIEDKDALNKTIENPIDNENKDTAKDKKVFMEKKKNTVIIRDTKHSVYNFFYLLLKCLVIMFKGFLIFTSIFLIIGIIFLAFLTFIFTWHIKDGLFFIGLLLASISTITCVVVLLKLIYNFIFNVQSDFKRIFLIFLISILGVGISFGISFCTYLSFSKNESLDKISSYNIEISDNTIIDFIDDDNTKMEIDNSLNDLKVDFKYNKYNKIYVDKTVLHANDINYINYTYHYGNDSFNLINYIFKSLKNKKRIDDSFEYEIVIHISQANLDKITNNFNNYDKIIDEENDCE